MPKIRVGILCGGQSSEHEISCISAAGVYNAIDRERFEPVLIGITRSGTWVLLPDATSLVAKGSELPEIDPSLPVVTTEIQGLRCGDAELKLDVIFPILHGPYGEDGTIQGFCEIAGIRYVGSGVLASAAAMDKSFAKSIFHSHGLQVAPGVVLHHKSWSVDQVKGLQYPVFVKPARSGSSRGTTKVKTPDQLADAITEAFEFDTKVLVEQAVIGREIECAVLDVNGALEAAPVGEIKIVGDHEFYDFEAKYLDGSTEVVFPTDLPEGAEHVIQEAALAAFGALGCEGLARVDFFYTPENELIINEINTMPGFTPTSMFPKMWARAGKSYSEVISHLIDAALTRSISVTR